VRLRFDPPPTLPATARVAILQPGTVIDLAGWISMQLGGSEVRRVSNRVGATTCGWPYELITFAVDDELAVLAAYGFVDLAAAIVIADLVPAQLAAYEKDLFRALEAVEPDWQSDEPRSISELWRERT